MINVNDLMRGNWVKVTFNKDEVGFGKDYYAQVDAIQKHKILLMGELRWHPIENIEPIPLTEQILNNISDILSTIEYNIEKKIVNNFIRINISLNYNFIQAVDYLHEYQNITKILTEQDLKIIL